MKSITSIFCALVFSFSAFVSFAGTTAEEQKADRFIQSVYTDKHLNQLPMPQRLETISQWFLNKPYLLGALGEGSDGRYDQFPLYRTDAFDCLTYVETVLALALSNNATTFQQTIKTIRYENGQVDFIKRHHFTELDWNAHHQKKGILKDITLQFRDQQGKAVTQMARALINKPAWYQHFTVSQIRLQDRTTPPMPRLLELQKRTISLPVRVATIPYIPLTALFNDKDQPNPSLFKQIPNGAIIEIVRPNWDLTEKIGTHLNVSHLGFAFWKQGELVFRNASSLKGKVMDQPLVQYLREAKKSSPTVKGINVQIVRR